MVPVVFVVKPGAWCVCDVRFLLILGPVSTCVCTVWTIEGATATTLNPMLFVFTISVITIFSAIAANIDVHLDLVVVMVNVILWSSFPSPLTFKLSACALRVKSIFLIFIAFIFYVGRSRLIAVISVISSPAVAVIIFSSVRGVVEIRP